MKKLTSAQEALEEAIKEVENGLLVLTCGECHGTDWRCGGCGGTGRPSNSAAAEKAKEIIEAIKKEQ